MTDSPTPPPRKRNIPMTVVGWALMAVLASFIVMAIEAVFFAIAVH